MMFKPSELPVGTVIQDNDPDHSMYWYKGDKGNWAEMFSYKPTSDFISDNFSEVPRILWGSYRTKENSDDFFKYFEIISLPIKVSSHLAESLSQYVIQQWQNESTPESELNESIRDIWTEEQMNNE
jgi:hypothetical protein